MLTVIGVFYKLINYLTLFERAQHLPYNLSNIISVFSLVNTSCPHQRRSSADALLLRTNNPFQKQIKFWFLSFSLWIFYNKHPSNCSNNTFIHKLMSAEVMTRRAAVNKSVRLKWLVPITRSIKSSSELYDVSKHVSILHMLVLKYSFPELNFTKILFSMFSKYQNIHSKFPFV